MAAAVMLAAAMAQAAASRLEIREGGRLFGALAATPAGDRLLLKYQGQEFPLGECVEERRNEASSPRGLVASVFERNCGATVDFATHVELRAGDERVSLAVFAGRMSVALKWSAERLTVAHAPLGRERVFRRVERATMRRSRTNRAVPRRCPRNTWASPVTTTVRRGAPRACRPSCCSV